MKTSGRTAAHARPVSAAAVITLAITPASRPLSSTTASVPARPPISRLVPSTTAAGTIATSTAGHADPTTRDPSHGTAHAEGEPVRAGAVKGLFQSVFRSQQAATGRLRAMERYEAQHGHEPLQALRVVPAAEAEAGDACANTSGQG